MIDVDVEPSTAPIHDAAGELLVRLAENASFGVLERFSILAQLLAERLGVFVPF